MSNQTDLELKRVLKTLFAEKKRIKHMQKELDEQEQRKIGLKLTEGHQKAVYEEIEKLQNAFREKEEEVFLLKDQIEKIKPSLKLLIHELKKSRTENENLKGQISNDATKVKEEQLIQALAASQEKIFKLETEKKLLEEEGDLSLKEGMLVIRKQMNQLEELCESEKKQNAHLEEEKKGLTLSLEKALKALEEKNQELQSIQTQEEKQLMRFEEERGRLVEKLAETLSQVQRQNENIKELKEQHSINETTALQLKEELGREKEVIASQHEEWKKKEAHFLEQEKFWEETRIQLEKSDIATLQKEFEAKIQHCQLSAQTQLEGAVQESRLMLEEKEAAAEQLLERAYYKLRELSQKHATLLEERGEIQTQCDETTTKFLKLEKETAALRNNFQNVKLQHTEKEAEIRKAQQHLAKKVKETTVLQDQLERQKNQCGELQVTLAKQKQELDQLHQHINIQRVHEEKLQLVAKERADSAELLAKQWQEKYITLQQDWQEKKEQLLELQKMRRHYDQMLSTVSALKTLLGKASESSEI